MQNAGAKAAGTGLQKSAITQKIALSQAGQAAATGNRNSTNIVDVVTVDANPPIINPNGESRCPFSRLPAVCTHVLMTPLLTHRRDQLQGRPGVHGRGAGRQRPIGDVLP